MAYENRFAPGSKAETSLVQSEPGFDQGDQMKIFLSGANGESDVGVSQSGKRVAPADQDSRGFEPVSQIRAAASG